MELKFLFPYKMLRKYIDSVESTKGMGRNNDCPILEANRRMGRRSCDFMKPAQIKDDSIIKNKLKNLKPWIYLKIPHQTIFNESIYSNWK